MPQIEITIGGRNFDVACQDGEEQFLRSAAGLLDVEASSLSTQVGRMPESRMLLMAGLLLADRTGGLEDTVRQLEAKLANAEAQLEFVQQEMATPKPEVAPPEQPEISEHVIETMTLIASRAEELADDVDRLRA